MCIRDRVSKDLTDQEYSNICRDLQVVSKDLDIAEIEFTVDQLRLIKSSEGNYEILMSFNDSARIKS